MDFEQDSTIGATDESLDELSALATQQIELEDALVKAEELVSSIKTNLKIVAEQQIPEKMSELRMKKFTLQSGFTIQVDPFYSGKIDKTNPEPAFAWLKEHGFDDIIKNKIICSFGKGEDQMAQDAYDLLGKEGYGPQQDKSVHAQTLKAFIKEQVTTEVERVEETDFKPFPRELFNVYIGQKTKIKRSL